ncbi:hypothetical protein [Butyricimonas synergistica]|uniref:hypothetical protein n=1 Tax=Butyricimonas synergistica TaxID=544644 RepID=UPI000379EA56|nr:hypothetical protein [Butyricimonas synergistica]
MKKGKTYQKAEEQPQSLHEPVATYGIVACSVDDYLNAIPENTMRSLIDSSLEDFHHGRCTSHSRLDSWIKDRMGWK